MADKDTLQVEKALKQLKCSYDMYETTKKQTEKKMKEALNKDGTKKYTAEDIKEEIALITEAQNDVVKQYVQLGGKEEDIRKKSKRKTSNISKENIGDTVLEMMQNTEDERKKTLNDAISATSTRMEQTYIPTKGNYNSEEAFDIINLPSKGEGYKEKIAKMSE